MVAAAVVAFQVTYRLDLAADSGRMATPGWAIAGSADAARQILIGVSAAVITVAGVVFSITILALQLASQQFGPRMLRNFIRDVGTQVSLGAFVATFVYSVMVLGSVAHGRVTFVPHISVTLALALTLCDLGVLIYFISHVATSIQLTTVVASIARDFRVNLEGMHTEAGVTNGEKQEEAGDVRRRFETGGGIVWAGSSGFLQAVGHERLVRIAASADATIRLMHRAGHFVAEGQQLALVWPPQAVDAVSHAMARAHIVGPNRTLTQDLGFAIDQLAEVAIRALSPAVNDTFTALNCIDWLGDCMCRAARQPLPDGIYRDSAGVVRVIDPAINFERLLKKATDKIRQAGVGMPAVLIRQLENLSKVAVATREPAHTEAIAHQGRLVLAAGERSVQEDSDRYDIRAVHDSLLLKLAAASG
jgi:uncharacterized membrane protein